MKTTTFALILFLTGLNVWAQPAPTVRQTPSRVRSTDIATNTPAAVAPAATPAVPVAAPVAAPAAPAPATTPGVNPADSNETPADASQPEEMIPAGNINFQGVDVSQVLEVYAKLVGRTLLRAGLPAASIVLKTETPLTKSEAIQALQAVLVLNGISVINIGDKFVKVLPMDQANTAGAEFNDAVASQLPDLGAYVTHIVQLKNIKPSEMVPIIQPFARLANSILPIDSNGILVLRDNAENVKRMLQMIERVDVSVPAEYISEVIPIKYALAEDIANALNSLGGTGGGSTVSIGGSSGSSTTGGARSMGGGSTGGFGGGLNTGLGGGYQGQQQRGLGTTTAAGTPSGGATSFQQRLQSIIQRASGTGGQPDAIQVFGQTKIIADQRSNSLLIFATRQDMVSIKNVIDKLDVLLSQVLIESVVMEVSLGKNWNFGVSAAQRPQQFNNSSVVGGGIMNNGNGSFLDILKTVATNGVSQLSGSFPSNGASGLNYFANINQNYDIAVQAAESDNSITIIQKPRIQTFQAQPATFFVGSTVPYVTSTYNGGTTGIGSSYSQLSVGVSLQVTPFINPDGLVVMQIEEEIDNISGYTTIDGNPVPNTSKKSLSSNVAVKDRDSIILGGAIYSSKSLSKSGVPLLMDIPLLGALFSSRTSDKQRQELLVLMRPTVLRTPELASLQAKKEEARLPGIAHAESEDTKAERKQVQAEERLLQLQEEKEARAAAKADAKAAAKAKRNGTVPPASQTTKPLTDAPATGAQTNSAPGVN
ncbi:MAG: secretin N-terminal domain-containing protein [Verrucomicrobiales bacterium]|nr:secretin N-terminal domain-containing protein [Verrucomicrobiales bacterium]